MKKLLLNINLVLLSSLSVTYAVGQNAGDLDTDFGIGGYSVFDPYSNTGELYWDMITLSDDKIIKVGYTDDGGDTDILVAKFQANGLPDSTFGVNGFTTIDLSLGQDEDARGVYEMASGQLLITGYVQTPGSLDGYVMRMNADGTVDNSFGTSSGHTKFNTGDNLVAYGRSVIESGSQIFVGGAAVVGAQLDFVVVKFTIGGGIDAAFSSGGYATMDIAGGNDNMQAMDIKANGSFVFGGTADSMGVLLGVVGSMTQFGTPSTFAGDGSYTFDMGSGLNEVNDLYVDANDNTVFTGDEGLFPNLNGFVTRLTPTGDLDNTFGTNGTLMSDPGATTALYFRSLMETPNGEIVAVGNFDGASQDIYAMMLDQGGSPISEFGGNGDVIVPFAITTNLVTTMAGDVQADGSIIVAGYLESQDFVGENMFMVRLHPLVDDASINELNAISMSTFPNPASHSFEVEGDADVESVELISLTGQVAQTWEAQEVYTLAENVMNGTYILKITTSKGIAVQRLAVQH